MKTVLSQEFYKFFYQKSTYIGMIFVGTMMFYIAITNPNSEYMMILEFGMAQWVAMVMIAISSNFFSVEFENGTILTMLYKASHKSTIYIAKFLVLLVYNVVLHIISIACALMLKIVFLNKYDWYALYEHRTVITSMGLNIIGSFAMTTLIISLVLVLNNWLKNNVVTIAIGLGLAFMGNGIMGAVMDGFKNLRGILKWNPMNMMRIMGQLPSGKYDRFTGLSNVELLYGNFIYIIFFLILGYILFKKRRV